jgi:GTP-binding protein HflX
VHESRPGAKRPTRPFFVGSGKADEIKAAVQTHEARASVILFDQSAERLCSSAIWSAIWNVPVAMTVPALILDIFAARAQQPRGQVSGRTGPPAVPGSTRLVRRWTHLERQSRRHRRQRGGPGETQIELDRRMIGERIKSVKARLEKVKTQRQTQRRARDKRRDTFTVSLVGYTNAGKTTLFNSPDVKSQGLSRPTSCLRPWIPRPGSSGWPKPDAPVSLSDTVGFIRDLPHKTGRGLPKPLLLEPR